MLFGVRLHAQPRLECSAEAPAIVADIANLRYLPMPIPVTLTVHNRGTALAHPVTATIVFDADLALAGDDAPDHFSKSVDPPGLFPTQIGKVQWMLRHPPSMTERSYTIRMFVHAPGADTVSCETTLIIPPLDTPLLSPRDYAPDKLQFDEATDSYVPNPFTLRLTCMNHSSMPATDVTGTLILPPNVELADPGDSLTKHFSPSTLHHWRIGDPVPELTWQVRWVPRLRVEKTPEFRFLVTGTYMDSLRLDTVEVRSHTRVPGLQPYFGGCMRIPDSLGLREDGTDVTPNPFTVRYPLRNISHIAGGLRRVYISFPPDGLNLNPASPWPMNRILDEVVEPGDSVVFEWQIDVTNRITRRRVLIQVTVINDEGNPILCEDWLPIAAVSVTDVRDEASPLAFRLSAPYPNPFHSTSTLEFRLTRAAPVTIVISDALSREVRRLLDAAPHAPGRHSIRFDARGLAPGLYHCMLSDGKRTARRSMILLP
ncbi:MAG: hypothetical protein KFF77_07600 [Bacteroidetes bacterium]|nr:hypothetical protein [Bacteroidota bacterium]